MKKAHKFQLIRNSDKMKQNISQNTDSGRSMVEMLGVLAVIGVLSVASILGYRFAMAKWRANETVNELNIRAYDIATRFDKLVASNTREIEMEMGNTTKLGYPIMARISPQYEDYFEMFVSDVPSDVCKELLNSQWQAPYSIFVGIEEYEASADICEQAENVQLAYEFYKDLSDRDEIPEEIQHKVQRCNHNNNCQCGTCNEEIGLCESYCHDGEVCEKNFNNPREKICCEKGLVLNGYCCTSVTEDGKCCTEEGTCCPANQPLYDSNGNCYSCSSGTIISGGNTVLCEIVCPGRRLYNNSCYRQCSGSTPIVHWWGGCSSCEQEGSYPRFPEDCEKFCPNNYLKNDGYNLRCWPRKCSGETPLEQLGNCYACDTPVAIDIAVNPNCLTECPDRVLSTDKKSCVLKSCPSTHPLLGKDGGCYACTYENTVDQDGVADKNCETACPGRRLYNNSCYRQCSGSTPIVHWWGGCSSCSDEGSYPRFTEDCEKFCEHNYLKSDGYNLRCWPRKCSGETPLEQLGSCYACDTPVAIDISINPKCLTECPDRVLSTDKKSCVLKSCPSTHPLLGKDGGCYACAYGNTVNQNDVADKNCETACPGRRLNNNYCYRQCSGSTPIVHWWGGCSSCSENGSYPKFPEDCEKLCEHNYLKSDGYDLRCWVKPCSEWGGYFKGSDGNCYMCNNPLDIQVDSKEDCDDLCMNRTYKEGYCIDTN